VFENVREGREEEKKELFEQEGGGENRSYQRGRGGRRGGEWGEGGDCVKMEGDAARCVCVCVCV